MYCVFRAGDLWRLSVATLATDCLLSSCIMIFIIHLPAVERGLPNCRRMTVQPVAVVEYSTKRTTVPAYWNSDRQTWIGAAAVVGRRPLRTKTHWPLPIASSAQDFRPPHSHRPYCCPTKRPTTLRQSLIHRLRFRRHHHHLLRHRHYRRAVIPTRWCRCSAPVHRRRTVAAPHGERDPSDRVRNEMTRSIGQRPIRMRAAHRWVRIVGVGWRSS